MLYYNLPKYCKEDAYDLKTIYYLFEIQFELGSLQL